jgi:hypothetical protein
MCSRFEYSAEVPKDINPGASASTFLTVSGTPKWKKRLMQFV